jgi:hypothetical protein
MTQFEKGHKKVGGRKKGSRNKLKEEFFAAYLTHFKKHGAAVFDLMFKENPTEYAKLCGSFFRMQEELAGENQPRTLQVRWKAVRRIIITPDHPDHPKNKPQPAIQESGQPILTVVPKVVGE